MSKTIKRLVKYNRRCTKKARKMVCRRSCGPGVRYNYHYHYCDQYYDYPIYCSRYRYNPFQEVTGNLFLDFLFGSRYNYGYGWPYYSFLDLFDSAAFYGSALMSLFYVMFFMFFLPVMWAYVLVHGISP